MRESPIEERFLHTRDAMNNDARDARPDDPREAGAKPEYPQQRIEGPGHEDELTPRADHGEESYMGIGRLTGYATLITGADSGIGRAVAIAFAREGADVVISYLPEEEQDARETARWVEDAGRSALRLPGDIRDESHCRALVAGTLERFGRLDVLVNNAAFQSTQEKVEDFSSDEFDRAFKTNVYAMFWLCRAALPKMHAGNSVINTASIQAYDPSPNLLPYAATKGAIVNFTKALSPLASKQGVRVNAVAPGPVWTPLIPSTMPPDQIKQFGADTAFGRAAQPAELAPLYVFLASNDARFVTGEVFGATGGQSPF
jgi:NAD(P)-dependent dehydrogenase (short-subunit alcohol dehydrogenase family)